MFLLLKYSEDAIFFCLLELQDHVQFSVLLQVDGQILIFAVKRMMGNLCSPWAISVPPGLTDLASQAANRKKAKPISLFLQCWL